MQFQQGKPKTGGRQVGTPNRLTAAFKEAVAIVYDNLGGTRRLQRGRERTPVSSTRSLRA